MSKLTQDSIKWIKSLKRGDKVIVAQDGKRYYAIFMDCNIINEDNGLVTVDAEYAKIEQIDFRDIFKTFNSNP
jgi:hypothetical protein